MEEQLVAQVAGGIGILTLNRPTALNALTLGMLEGLTAQLDTWEKDPAITSVELRGAGEKAFCAGGDVRALYERFKAADPKLLDFFVIEYALDHRIHTYPKPVAAVMDGIVMGGGMGLAQGARRRIVTDKTRMAMPETAIGLFPDVGGSWFLPRCPGKVGLYLGLTGATIKAADALHANLADEYRGESLPAGELEALRPAIDDHFAKPSVTAILESLLAEDRGAYKDWALRTLEALSKRSPTMLEVTFRQLSRGAGMGLADAFRMELGLIAACFRHGDFAEGIRALLIDKDNNPRWNPPALDQVNPAIVAAFFQPPWSPDRHPLAHL